MTRHPYPPANVRGQCDLCRWHGRWTWNPVYAWHHAVMHQSKEHRDRPREQGWMSASHIDDSPWIDDRLDCPGRQHPPGQRHAHYPTQP
jgi:hypothetical protein